MAYLIYLRKSRADEEAELSGAGDTLARHRRELYETARRQHLTIGACYEEVVSGDTIAARPQMQRLLTEVEAGLWEGVLVMEVARLARGDTIDQGVVARAFKMSGTRIVTPSKTYEPDNEMDEEYFEFSLFMSRQEYKYIRRRMQRGVQAAHKEGKFTGPTAPYGYEKIKLRGERGNSLVPVPDQAEVYRMMVSWVLDQGLSISEVRQQLNQSEIPGPMGNPWSSSTVSLLLRNPIHAGYISSPRRPQSKTIEHGQVIKHHLATRDFELYEGRHEAIIPSERWRDLQAALSRNTSPKINRKTTGLQNPFAKLLYCSECGSAMQRTWTRNNKNTHVFCLRRRQQSCPTVSSRMDQVEDLVLGGLRQLLVKYEVAAAQQSQPDTQMQEKRLERLTQELERLDEQISRARDLVETGVYTIPEYQQRRKELDRRRQKLTTQQVEAQHQLHAASDIAKMRAQFIPRVRNVLEVYHLCETPEQKNRLLRTVIDRIIYHKTEKASKHHPECTATLDIYPLVPLPAQQPSLSIGNKPITLKGSFFSLQLSAPHWPPRAADSPQRSASPAPA